MQKCLADSALWYDNNEREINTLQGDTLSSVSNEITGATVCQRATL